MTPADIPHLARHLMEKHGLLKAGYIFKLDNSKRRAGYCRWGGGRQKYISLSRHYVRLNTETHPELIVDTILHEIAHALTPGHHHDDAWKAKCVEIGARPERCYDSFVVEMPAGRFAASCGQCHRTYTRHKPTKRELYCKECYNKHGFIDAARLKYVDTNSHQLKTAACSAPPPNVLR